MLVPTVHPVGPVAGGRLMSNVLMDQSADGAELERTAGQLTDTDTEDELRHMERC